MTDKMNRRDFLKLAAGSLVVLTGSYKFLENQGGGDPTKTGDQPTGKPRPSWAMVIDQEKCNGCEICIDVCKAHNDTNPEINWTRIYPGDEIGGHKTFMPVPCMHCDNAPCVGVCPVKATYQRADGIVMMDYDRCIGCRYCELACPYQARSFNWSKFDGENPLVPEFGQPEVDRRPRGVVEKCSFCYQRIDRGLANGLTPGIDRAATPACVVHCPQGARTFGDLNDPESPVSKVLANRPNFQMRPDLGTGPRVYYLSPIPEEV